MQRATRRNTIISEEQHKQNMQTVDTTQSGGGLGIPGGRKEEDVLKFTPLSFGKGFSSDLTGILQGSHQYRQLKQSGSDIEKGRKIASKVNRRINYGKGVGTHSLHMGTDIAAVFNGRRGNRVYTYEDLTRKLDRRIAMGMDNPKAPQRWKKFFNQPMDADKRRKYIAGGIGEIVQGDLKSGLGIFGQAGMNKRGAKWAYKMTTVLMAERARELHGKSKKNLVLKSVNFLKQPGNTFENVYVTKHKELAPFSGKGGAKSFKK